MSNPTNGKGSRQRSVADKKQFENNWAQIFGSKEKKNAKDSDSTSSVPQPKQR